MPKNKGLADTQEGEFVLNESGTSVSTDPVDNDEAATTNEDPEDGSDDRGEGEA
jgi:hypothetical protein